MLDDTTDTDMGAASADPNAAAPARPRRRAARRPAGPPAAAEGMESPTAVEPPSDVEPAAAAPAKKKAPARKRATKKTAAAVAPEPAPVGSDDVSQPTSTDSTPPAPVVSTVAPIFQPPDPAKAKRPARKKPAAAPEPAADSPETSNEASEAGDSDSDSGTTSRRRRRRGGRRRRTSDGADSDGGGAEQETTAAAQDAPAGEDSSGRDATDTEQTTSSRRRRRRRGRAGEDVASAADDPADTVVKVRESRAPSSDITSVTGSARLEAKKQRRRDGRDAGRRRPPILSEAEFLARREAVKRTMLVRQRGDLSQIAVLEDDVLVEHYVARESQTSLIGNVYLGRVQNVLPSMEAAFVDIGMGRNAILYAGEVNWDLLGTNGQPRRIETALKSGQQVLVQVSKDPVGHKGARLTSQISLAGRYLVYVPEGQSSGISRKLPDTERDRLKALLKQIVPEDAGVIIRTAAEGATEEQLTRDVNRLTARWEDITKKADGGKAPQLLYGEPDLTLKVVRDLFTEDFGSLVVAGGDAWDTVEAYVGHVAPELTDRLQRWEGEDDVFAAYRVDEQLAKGLDRKVFLPSGGSLVIDRTEAMTVVDVNTGKFTGSGGNLEQTVTKNNLEAAEEIVRQLRLRDIGGIIVIDFIDMVLEANRDLVMRRLIECLGRDRTKHQVAEVSSLGLVQMTRKRIGTGLLEAFGQPCEHCGGRGLHVQLEPVESAPKRESARRSRGGSNGKAPTADPDAQPADGTPPDAAPKAEPAPVAAAPPELPPATTPRKRTRKAAAKSPS